MPEPHFFPEGLISVVFCCIFRHWIEVATRGSPLIAFERKKSEAPLVLEVLEGDIQQEMDERPPTK